MHTEMCAQVQHAARIRDGHLEPARSGDADDSEGAEADSALPRRRCLHDRGLIGLGLVLLLGRGLLRLLGLGLGLGLLDLDLERAELVVPSKDAMVLPNGRGLGGSHACRRGEGVQLDRGVGSGCTSSCPSSSYYYFIFVLASSSCGLRLMWFNGWLCNLAPVAAACGRGRLHVRLLWSGAQAGVQGLSATRRTVFDSEVASDGGRVGGRVEGRVGGRAESGGAAP